MLILMILYPRVRSGISDTTTCRSVIVIDTSIFQKFHESARTYVRIRCWSNDYPVQQTWYVGVMKIVVRVVLQRQSTNLLGNVIDDNDFTFKY